MEWEKTVDRKKIDGTIRLLLTITHSLSGAWYQDGNEIVAYFEGALFNRNAALDSKIRIQLGQLRVSSEKISFDGNKVGVHIPTLLSSEEIIGLVGGRVNMVRA